MWQEIDKDTLRFSVYTAVTKKAGDSEKKERILHGVASGDGEDQQGEIVLQGGIETDFLLQKGTLNWEHRGRDNPGLIIGKPIKAELNKNQQLYTAARLHKTGRPMADEAWGLAQYYEENPDDGALGWSIEGLGIRKGNVVVKCILRALALTVDPAFGDSWATVLKAMSGRLDDVHIIGKSARHDFDGEPFPLSALNSEAKVQLLNEMLMGEVPHPDKVYKSAGQYNGPFGLHWQLVQQGIPPKEATKLVKHLKTAFV